MKTSDIVRLQEQLTETCLSELPDARTIEAERIFRVASVEGPIALLVDTNDEDFTIVVFDDAIKSSFEELGSNPPIDEVAAWNHYDY